jgi:hypothetical protein
MPHPRPSVGLRRTCFRRLHDRVNPAARSRALGPSSARAESLRPLAVR